MDRANQTQLASLIKRDSKITYKERINLVWRLSIPAILAQITSIVMQYIDASMVGSLGATASASIGLVSSSTWLLGGLCSGVSAGFSVQVAQYLGANNTEKANKVLKQALFYATCFSVILCLFGISISRALPIWLRADSEIAHDASMYFLVYAISIPALQMSNLAGSMLQCSGNMKLPSILNSLMCLLDVIFNALLIFPTKVIMIGSLSITLPGMNLGVLGAAIGTALAELLIACAMLWALCVKSSIFRLKRENSWIGSFDTVKRAIKIGVPMGFEHAALCGAMVVTTRIVAPLGTVAIAANSFGVTAESLCYMPGYGIAAAATTLVGQCIGANNKTLAKKFAWLTVSFGMILMTLTGALMYVICPVIFQMLTPDVQVQTLGIQVLRIEVFAEPLFALSIVASGALRGAGDTLIPSILNLVSIWGVRLTVALLLVGSFGLRGVWLAMCIELCVRGSLFFVRLKCGKWL